MNEEKTLYALNTKTLLHQAFAFLSFKEHDDIDPSVYLSTINTIVDLQKIAPENNIVNDLFPNNITTVITFEVSS